MEVRKGFPKMRADPLAAELSPKHCYMECYAMSYYDKECGLRLRDGLKRLFTFLAMMLVRDA